ncbi:hypothetical protein RA11412_1069 [Rothia aeria]|uniref:Uncharacterized protein n=1 Tax=Rothia aeria TaxID=172042 RepID=A0A2Z5QY33_9MICC|nr:hypothetical protein RA11412_1069 [Rothia aeria]
MSLFLCVYSNTVGCSECCSSTTPHREDIHVANSARKHLYD